MAVLQSYGRSLFCKSQLWFVALPSKLNSSSLGSTALCLICNVGSVHRKRSLVFASVLGRFRVVVCLTDRVQKRAALSPPECEVSVHGMAIYSRQTLSPRLLYRFPSLNTNPRPRRPSIARIAPYPTLTHTQNPTPSGSH